MKKKHTKSLDRYVGKDLYHHYDDMLVEAEKMGYSLEISREEPGFTPVDREENRILVFVNGDGIITKLEER